MKNLFTGQEYFTANDTDTSQYLVEEPSTKKKAKKIEKTRERRKGKEQAREGEAEHDTEQADKAAKTAYAASPEGKLDAAAQTARTTNQYGGAPAPQSGPKHTGEPSPGANVSGEPTFKLEPETIGAHGKPEASPPPPQQGMLNLDQPAPPAGSAKAEPLELQGQKISPPPPVQQQLPGTGVGAQPEPPAATGQPGATTAGKTADPRTAAMMGYGGSSTKPEPEPEPEPPYGFGEDPAGYPAVNPAEDDFGVVDSDGDGEPDEPAPSSPAGGDGGEGELAATDDTAETTEPAAEEQPQDNTTAPEQAKPEDKEKSEQELLNSIDPAEIPELAGEWLASNPEETDAWDEVMDAWRTTPDVHSMMIHTMIIDPNVVPQGLGLDTNGMHAVIELYEQERPPTSEPQPTALDQAGQAVKSAASGLQTGAENLASDVGGLAGKAVNLATGAGKVAAGSGSGSARGGDRASGIPATPLSMSYIPAGDLLLEKNPKMAEWENQQAKAMGMELGDWRQKGRPTKDSPEGQAELTSRMKEEPWVKWYLKELLALPDNFTSIIIEDLKQRSQYQPAGAGEEEEEGDSIEAIMEELREWDPEELKNLHAALEQHERTKSGKRGHELDQRKQQVSSDSEKERQRKKKEEDEQMAAWADASVYDSLGPDATVKSHESYNLKGGVLLELLIQGHDEQSFLEQEKISFDNMLLQLEDREQRREYESSTAAAHGLSIKDWRDLKSPPPPTYSEQVNAMVERIVGLGLMAIRKIKRFITEDLKIIVTKFEAPTKEEKPYEGEVEGGADVVGGEKELEGGRMKKKLKKKKEGEGEDLSRSMDDFANMSYKPEGQLTESYTKQYLDFL